MEILIKDTKNFKFVRSKNYNYNFRKSDGYFERWGKTNEDDPQYAPGPEIVDMEISTICYQGCNFCYKGNSSVGDNMSFKTFKKIFDKLPKLVNQIAFGIGSLADKKFNLVNPDIWKIFKYCREKDVIPNVTINGFNMTSKYYDSLAKLCGAVAVSHYDDNVCYNAVKELTDRGMTQCNIHQLLSLETLDQCHQTIDDKLKDTRLEKLNAIVFLTLKPKGIRNKYHSVSKREDIVKLIKHAVKAEVNFGFDSCFAPIFEDVAKDIYPEEQLKNILQSCEPCESVLMSSFVDVKGNFVPCSFCPNQEGIEPISVLDAKNFIKDIWNNPKTVGFREKLLKNNRKCPVFPAIYNMQGERENPSFRDGVKVNQRINLHL